MPDSANGSGILWERTVSETRILVPQVLEVIHPPRQLPPREAWTLPASASAIPEAAATEEQEDHHDDDDEGGGTHGPGLYTWHAQTSPYEKVVVIDRLRMTELVGMRTCACPLVTSSTGLATTTSVASVARLDAGPGVSSLRTSPVDLGLIGDVCVSLGPAASVIRPAS